MPEEKEKIYCINCAPKILKQQVLEPNYLFFIYLYMTNIINIIVELISRVKQLRSNIEDIDTF